ncbi:hypothetical protein BDY19DRAFT_956652 [Irpex rosettiformis]|uniref:Uncharacterized protein n=1 Tax=Irpex rosettiformis TaxID=378272 RepID=A0ACB8TYP1_9APHY|nr:hypothetical protein BDY19DRAFT_956652 [Irpex rosettiformis]
MSLAIPKYQTQRSPSSRVLILMSLFICTLQGIMHVHTIYTYTRTPLCNVLSGPRVSLSVSPATRLSLMRVGGFLARPPVRFHSHVFRIFDVEE